MKRLIPFRLLPASWGLAGRAFDEAEAYYSLQGEALDRRLAEIALASDPKALAARLLDLDLQHGRIDAYGRDLGLLALRGLAEDARANAEVMVRHGQLTPADFDRRMAEKEHEAGVSRDLALLDVRLKHNEIGKLEYDKQRATLQEAPWIGIVDQGFDPAKGMNGVYFEFDWNGFWIDYLRLNGYVGRSEEEIVEGWFQTVCRATAATPLPGDDGAADSGGSTQRGKPGGSPEAGVGTRRSSNHVRRDDGTFYS